MYQGLSFHRRAFDHHSGSHIFLEGDQELACECDDCCLAQTTAIFLNPSMEPTAKGGPWLVPQP